MHSYLCGSLFCLQFFGRGGFGSNIILNFGVRHFVLLFVLFQIITINVFSICSEVQSWSWSNGGMFAWSQARVYWISLRYCLAPIGCSFSGLWSQIYGFLRDFDKKVYFSWLNHGWMNALKLLNLSKLMFFDLYGGFKRIWS